MNLAQGLVQELKRNRELLEDYKEIGPNGAFGAMAISNVIAQAEKAQGEDDVVEMLKCYENLKLSQ